MNIEKQQKFANEVLDAIKKANGFITKLAYRQGDMSGGEWSFLAEGGISAYFRDHQSHNKATVSHDDKDFSFSSFSDAVRYINRRIEIAHKKSYLRRISEKFNVVEKHGFFFIYYFGDGFFLKLDEDEFYHTSQNKIACEFLPTWTPCFNDAKRTSNFDEAYEEAKIKKAAPMPTHQPSPHQFSDATIAISGFDCTSESRGKVTIVFNDATQDLLKSAQDFFTGVKR